MFTSLGGTDFATFNIFPKKFDLLHTKLTRLGHAAADWIRCLSEIVFDMGHCSWCVPCMACTEFHSWHDTTWHDTKRHWQICSSYQRRSKRGWTSNKSLCKLKKNGYMAWEQGHCVQVTLPHFDANSTGTAVSELEIREFCDIEIIKSLCLHSSHSRGSNDTEQN